MLCCCREKLDITDDTPPAHAKSAAQTDSEKEKAFSEAVTAHPSPAVTPVTKQPDNAPVPAAGHSPPSSGQPTPTSVQQPPVAATDPAPVQVSQTESSVVEQTPVVEETIRQSAGHSVDTTPTRGPNVSVVQVSPSGISDKSGAVSQMVLSAKDQAILSQIESLSQTIDKAAERGELKGREACSVYANQLSILTSQVQKEASGMSESALQNAVARLESVAARLESLAVRGGGGSAGDSGEVAAFVTAFDDVLSGNFAKYLSLSSTIGGDVKTQANIVQEAFQAQRRFLVVASKSKAPSSAVLGPVVKPTADKLTAVQEFREKNRTSATFNHLSAISESIAALGWVTVTPAPGPFVKEMKDAGMFYTNRVLKDFKEKKEGGQSHVDWVKAWLGTLTDLQDYIKQYHTTGVTWNPSGGDAAAAAAAAGGAAAPPPPPAGGPPPPPPPPPPGPPPPPAAVESSDDGADSRAALFADLNRGEAVTTGLRKVTDDMKTHKNPALRQGPAPFKSSAPKPVAAPKPTAVAKAAPAKPPLIELQNKKWVVEYHTGNKSIVLDQTELKQVVYVFKCVDSVVQVKGKVNSIILDSCKKTAVVFDDLVSSLEFVNCQSMQGQVIGKVPTISIDKTDGCMVYLSTQSLDTEIVTAKSSEMNILVPVRDGDYTEFALPEQFKTTWNGSSMVTVQTDSI